MPRTAKDMDVRERPPRARSSAGPCERAMPGYFMGGIDFIADEDGSIHRAQYLKKLRIFLFEVMFEFDDVFEIDEIRDQPAAEVP